MLQKHWLWPFLDISIFSFFGVRLEFNDLVNTNQVMSSRSVYLTTLCLGRLSPLSSWHYLYTFFRQILHVRPRLIFWQNCFLKIARKYHWFFVCWICPASGKLIMWDVWSMYLAKGQCEVPPFHMSSQVSKKKIINGQAKKMWLQGISGYLGQDLSAQQRSLIRPSLSTEWVIG